MKALLVFDMPTECIECPLFDWIESNHDSDDGCCKWERVFNTPERSLVKCNEKPSWCPLKPIRWEAYDKQFDISFVAFKGEIK